MSTESLLSRLTHTLAGLLFVAALGGCATVVQPPPAENYVERAVARAGDDVATRAAVLAAPEVAEVFGARLDLVGIQPVYLEVRNLGAEGYLLFLSSVDRDYFSPYEVARRAAGLLNKRTDTLYPNLRDQEVPRYIPPGQTVSGFVYTHVDEGLKSFDIELLSSRRHQKFHVAVDVPGLTTDYADFDPDDLHRAPIARFDAPNDLRTWAWDLPCCAASAEGVEGDPLNLVLVGYADDVRGALSAAGWDVTAVADGPSIQRMVTAFLFGSRFRYAPVSELFLFGRGQDMAFQKARAAIDERNHIRLWLAPATLKEVPVWVGHVSRDAGVKLSGRLWPPTTHVIDPAVDDARYYVLQDLLRTRQVTDLGLVRATEAVEHDAPKTNAEGDPYFTDGLRMVVFLDDRFTALNDVRLLDWVHAADVAPFEPSGLFSAPDTAWTLP